MRRPARCSTERAFDDRDAEPGRRAADIGGVDHAGGRHVGVQLHREPAKGAQPCSRPRVSVTVFDPANPYYSVEIRGAAELVEDTGRSMPRILSRNSLGEDPPAEPADVIRMKVRV